MAVVKRKTTRKSGHQPTTPRKVLSSDTTDARNKIIDAIDDATSREKMSGPDAIKFLELLASDIDCRIDGVKDDMTNEEALNTSDK